MAVLFNHENFVLSAGSTELIVLSFNDRGLLQRNRNIRFRIGFRVLCDIRSISIGTAFSYQRGEIEALILIGISLSSADLSVNHNGYNRRDNDDHSPKGFALKKPAHCFLHSCYTEH